MACKNDKNLLSSEKVTPYITEDVTDVTSNNRYGQFLFRDH